MTERLSRKKWNEMSPDERDSEYKFQMAFHHEGRPITRHAGFAVTKLTEQLKKSSEQYKINAEANIKLAESLRFATWGLVIVGIVQIIVTLIK